MAAGEQACSLGDRALGSRSQAQKPLLCPTAPSLHPHRLEVQGSSSIWPPESCPCLLVPVKILLGNLTDRPSALTLLPSMKPLQATEPLECSEDRFISTQAGSQDRLQRPSPGPASSAHSSLQLTRHKLQGTCPLLKGQNPVFPCLPQLYHGILRRLPWSSSPVSPTPPILWDGGVRKCEQDPRPELQQR